jgi:coniferyl-aldehyde dehydrogenase
VAGTRIYVQEGIYDEFVKKAAELASKSVVGDPFNPSVSQGPQVYDYDMSNVRDPAARCSDQLNTAVKSQMHQVDKDQYEKVLRYIDIGKREGATLVTGGKPCGDNKGYYIEPTIFTDVKVKCYADSFFSQWTWDQKLNTNSNIFNYI